MSGDSFDPIALEILWSRLISIADEMWSTVLRTAVSTVRARPSTIGSPQPTIPSSVCIFRNSQRGFTWKRSSLVIFTCHSSTSDSLETRFTGRDCCRIARSSRYDA